MPRRTPTGRHSKIPTPTTGRTARLLTRVVAVGLVTVASIATFIGLTMRPATDAGGSQTARPATSAPQSTWPTRASRTGERDTPDPTTSSTASPSSPDSSRATRANSRAGDASDDSSPSTDRDREGTRLRERTPQSSSEVDLTKPPSPTAPSEEPSSPGRESSASPSPTPSTPTPSDTCETPGPEKTPHWRLRCKLGQLLP